MGKPRYKTTPRFVEMIRKFNIGVIISGPSTGNNPQRTNRQPSQRQIKAKRKGGRK